MSLLRPERERPWPPKPVEPENEVLRGTQQPRRSRHVEPDKPARGAWRWKPDTWTERADAWLWRHPVVHCIAGSLVVSGFLLALVYLVIKAARMQP